MIKINTLFGIISSIGGLIIIWNFVIDKTLRKKLRIKRCKILIRRNENLEELKFDIKNISNWEIEIWDMGFIPKTKPEKKISFGPFSPLSVRSKNRSEINFYYKISEQISNIKKLYIRHSAGKDYLYRKKRMLIKALEKAQIIGQS
jgi:hypothetical protein